MSSLQVPRRVNRPSKPAGAVRRGGGEGSSEQAMPLKAPIPQENLGMSSGAPHQEVVNASRPVAGSLIRYEPMRNELYQPSVNQRGDNTHIA